VFILGFPPRFRIPWACAAVLLVGWLVLACAWAQSPVWPTKPVRVIVPYPPGGPTDVVARVLFQQVAESMGQAFVIDHRPGAGGNIGAELVARSAPDGHTLLVATTAHAINASLFKKLNYDVLKDLAPVGLLTQGPLVLVTHPTFSANNVHELITLARSKPITFASSGNGQSTHLSAELFNALAGIKMTHVPYKGSAPALSDVMAGQVDVMFDTSLTAMPLVRAGKLKALGVTSAERSSVVPGVPTIAETGLAGYQVLAWNGVLVPQGTPDGIIQVLSEQIRKALQLPQVKAQFAAQGFQSANQTPEQFKAFLQKEVDQWARTVKSSGATID
jgi:tripartite-type tricarboxylate transporter receptor subunit TctC